MGDRLESDSLAHFDTLKMKIRTTCWALKKHCTTSRKVAGPIPDRVGGIFLWHNPSGRTMALGLTQPPTEMSTRNISCVVEAAGA